MPFRGASSDFSGMAPCLGVFITLTEDELWQHIEAHAAEACGEDLRLG
jgi:hypothetical protein